MGDFIDKSRRPWFCTWCNKNLYPTEREAQEAARHQSQVVRKKMFVYRCRVNSGWHLTSNPPQKG